MNVAIFRRLREPLLLAVEYARPAHALEYYDISKDPNEIDNVADRLTAPQKGELHRILEGLVHCHNEASCWGGCDAGTTPGDRSATHRGASGVTVGGSLDCGAS